MLGRSQAYNDGYAARGENKSVNDNPYSSGTPTYEDWLEGYSDANYDIINNQYLISP